MLRSAKWALPVLALGLLISFTAARAIAEDKAEKKDTGTVSGTVTGTDGKPAAKCLVRLFHSMDRANAHSAAKSSNSDKSETKAAGDEKPAKGEKGDKPIPVANATTDDAGKFTMKDVPVGKYEIIAQVKGVGRGHDTIEVKSGEDTSVDLKLERHEGGGKSGGDKTEKPAKSE